MTNNIVNTAANNANSAVINNMSKEQLAVLCKANLLNKGRGFCVVRKPTYSGGWYNEFEPLSYETKDFEYVEWKGTPMQFAKEMPTFTTHIEPFHSKPMDYTYTALEMLEMELD